MPKKSDTNKTYQELSQQLDGVVAKLQDPNVSIDDATRYYEQAMKLIKQLERSLEQAENRVREIRAQFGENA
jgi:exodeoxyribonuclease VII small subunit